VGATAVVEGEVDYRIDMQMPLRVTGDGCEVAEGALEVAGATCGLWIVGTRPSL